MNEKIKNIFARNKEAAIMAAGVSVTVFLGLAAVTGFPTVGRPVENQAAVGAAAGGYPSDDDEASIVQAIERTNPSVVSVVVSRDVPIVERFYRRFGPFPVFVPETRDLGSQEVEVGGGSGFIVSVDGLVVTNKHVVDEDDASYAVFLSDGTKYEAEVVARDPYFDVAFLRIKGVGPFAYLEFGDSDNLKLGQTVIAIGNALSEFRNSVSVGVVSGLSRSIVAGDRFGGNSELLEQVIQTDAAINPGNSGGPLLDRSGKVVGVNVAVALGSENIGFALPGNLAAGALKSVRERGEIVRPYLGVRTVTVTPELNAERELGTDSGALVSRGSDIYEIAVIPNSPAHDIGIREGDVILSIDGEKIDRNVSLAQLIRKRSVGDEIVIRLLREGVELTFHATLERYQEAQ